MKAGAITQLRIQTQRGLALALLLLAGLRPAAAALPDALDVLTRALFEEPVSDYSGVKQIVLYNGAAAEAIEMEVSCQASGSTRTDYLAPPSMRSRVVIDDGDYLYSYDPQLEITVRSNSPSRTAAFLDIDERRELIEANYILSLSTGEQVAGRDAYRIEVVSRHNYTPSRSVWIDSEKFVVLQSKEICGDSSANYSYSWIDFDEDLEDRIFDGDQFGGSVVEEEPLSARVSDSTLADRLDFTPVVPDELPGGFILVERMLTQRDGATYAVHLTYSDGLEGLSVFEERTSSRGLGGTNISLGDVKLRLNRSANYSVLQWEHAGVTYTLVGQLTRYGLLQIAGALINN